MQIIDFNILFLSNPDVWRDMWNWESLRWGEACRLTLQQADHLLRAALLNQLRPRKKGISFLIHPGMERNGYHYDSNHRNGIKLGKQDITMYPHDWGFKYCIFSPSYLASIFFFAQTSLEYQ